ncbi:fungal-specific transcription factor domain-containing protein [Mycena olivaceomarginata]|nr:fungal-specific transcription factor domain-containing protein [Mycena olivaceomarginata]
MSSNDEDYAPAPGRGTKRRLQRACDVCRRKKIGCDGSPREKCSTCIDANLDCTYVEGPVKRPPPKSYRELEARPEDSERLVQQLRAELANAHFASSSSNSNTPSPNSSHSPPRSDRAAEEAQQHPDVPTAALILVRSTLDNLTRPPIAPDPVDLLDLEVANKFDRLQLGGRDRYFFGKSSNGTLIKAALDLNCGPDAFRSENTRHVPKRARYIGPGDHNSPWTRLRPPYWTWKPLEKTIHPIYPYTFRFPSNTLLSTLIDLYFTRQNVYLPLLHRPTFERGVAEGLHLRDDGFAGTVLLVCAIGSRWSTDPGSASGGLECGWEWFNQVPLAGNRLLGPTTLSELQHYCLGALFLKASTMPHAWWTLTGVGLRLAQDIGVHRSKARIEVPSVERELFKRAFWMLVYLDRLSSCILGRLSSINHDEFDVEPPIECDDEFWEHPTRPFQQPAGVPSQITFFNMLMRLSNILSFILKMLYSLHKTNSLCGFDAAFQQQTITEIDSALNRWRDLIPEHLRWDPTRADPVFFDQSVALHCAFYHLQIHVHRPFIPMVRKCSSSSLPSLAVCTSAARACANMVDIQRRHMGDVPCTLNLNPIFTSGLVLMLNVLSGKRTGLLPDLKREISNVHKCMEAIRTFESRWQVGGVLWDILNELAHVGQLQLPMPSAGTPAGFEPDARVQQHGTDSDGNGQPATSTHITFTGSYGLPQTLDPPMHMDPSQFHFQFHGPTPTFSGGVPGVSSEPSAFTPVAASPPQSQSEDIFDPAQASRELESMINAIDSDPVWGNVPLGMEMDDWGVYFSNFSEMTGQGQESQGEGWASGTTKYQA